MNKVRVLSVSAQVAAHLRTQVESGVWVGFIPGVGTLAKQLGVNHKTVEAAMRQLEREGVLEGQGTGRKRRIALSGGKSVRRTTIGILPYEANDLFSSLMVEVQRGLVEAGHTVILAEKSLLALGMDVARVKRLIQRTKVDGWIVAGGSNDVLKWFSQQAVPAFALFGRRDGISIASVGPDKRTAFSEAVRQLIAHGHSRIVLICRSERRKPSPGITERLLLSELAAHGIPTSEYNLPDWEETREGFQELLSSLFRVTPPTALIVGAGEFFTATLQFLVGQGLRVPEHVSVISNDSAPGFEWCSPNISHIRWEIAPVVRRVVQWTTNVSRGKEDLKQTSTPAEFVPGGTIGPAATGRV